MLQSNYDFLLVFVSLIIGVLASYTALALVSRISMPGDLRSRGLWLAGGAAAMGLGVWSMHFIGMLAVSLPIPLGYDPAITAGSLLIAILNSYFALNVGTRGRLSVAKLATSGALMGCGIAAMHYTGMAAMRMAPSIQYRPFIVLLSVLIAVLASVAALWVFSRLSANRSGFLKSRRISAALLMGAAIAGMHYIGMAAADFPLGSVCGARLGISTNSLAAIAIVAAMGILTIALVLAELAQRLRTRALLLARAAENFSEAEMPESGDSTFSPRRYGARMIVVAASLALVFLWLSIAGVLIRGRQSALDAEERVLQRMSSVVEEQARHLFSLIEFFLVSTESILAHHGAEDPRTNAEFLSLVDSLRKQTHGRIDVQIIFADGIARPIAPTDGNAASGVGRWEFLQSASDRRGLRIGKPVLDGASGQWRLPVARPVVGASGGTSLIVAALEIRMLNELYEGGRTKPGGSIGLLHRDGTVLARAPGGEQLIGKSIASGKIWKEHLPRSNRGVTVLPTTVVDNTARLTDYSAMPDFPLVVIASSAMDDVLATWQQWLYGAVLCGLALSTLIVFGARQLIFLLTRLSEAHAQVRDRSLRDALTGLPNRRMFHDRLEQEIKRADRSGLPVALLFLDLDLFKEVNDTLGHDAGDMLLQEVAQRLNGCVRGGTDTVARLGGDEFTIILSGLPSPGIAERVANDILEALEKPFYLKGEAAYVSASIGITLYPEDAKGIEDLIKNGDQAMYAAKKLGRNRWKHFAPTMQAAAQSRLRLIKEARSGLAEGQFRLYYQPIVDLKTGQVRKAEALLRWIHPVRGFISPSEFIPIIEESELIVALGDWVFREAAGQAARWRETIDPEFQIAVNKSPVQFKHRANGSGDWTDHLHSIGLPGSAIAIEITEGLILDANESVAARLQGLADAGIQLSLDDFGTGYSSLSYLKKFDIDYIKIDRSFVTNLESSAEDNALCEGIIAMAHKLGVKVVAEGVESLAQRALLDAMGCDYAQGFLFSKAVPAEDFAAQVRIRRSPLRQKSSEVVAVSA